MCKHQDQQQQPQQQVASAIFQAPHIEHVYQICAINHNEPRSIVLDHQLYNHLEERWTRQPFAPQPFIILTARVTTSIGRVC